MFFRNSFSLQQEHFSEILHRTYNFSFSLPKTTITTAKRATNKIILKLLRPLQIKKQLQKAFIATMS